ncbi:Lsr2 family protein [Umezawaea sp. Da 62-37]|uniref:histone-like nucleoid-structuring protein Lsr2 n=1 Tax=Umezawaea sp. Da 62-37 TaxID=3075927 RepID=UPI0028F713BC|nr:Lsr2 family protein [Umezawaea sp. Da 62-37]WNV92130.1 Lsr2 family protein [Umezawaea sp. Da 62-37]
MAQKVLVQLIDDVDGTASDDIATVRFGLDGIAYEIDLTSKNGDRLRDALADFVSNARKVGGRAKRNGEVVGARPVAGRSKEQTLAIREWAKSHGHALADRGRIPASAIEAFEAAHN